jgi:hypothetical protein
MTSSLDLYANTIEDYIVELKNHIELVRENKSSHILDNIDLIYHSVNDTMRPIQLINNALHYNSSKHNIYWNNYCVEQTKQSTLVKQTLPYMIPFILYNMD